MTGEEGHPRPAKRPQAVAILGGTGPQGRGLALRLAAAGHRVTVGSRSAASGAGAAAELSALLDARPKAAALQGMSNRDAAASAAVVFVSVPYEGHAPLLSDLARELAGRVLVDVVVPLKGPDVSRAWRPSAGSAAEEAQAILGDRTTVVAGFHHVSARKLRRVGEPVDCDVLLCGDDPEAKERVMTLTRDMGLWGFDAGPLANAAVLEGLTAVLIGLNRRHGVRSAGVRITDVPRGDGR